MHLSSSTQDRDSGTKTFRARSPRAALDAIKLALGPDAVIVSCRDVGPTLFADGHVEVVARRPEPGEEGHTATPEAPEEQPSTSVNDEEATAATPLSRIRARRAAAIFGSAPSRDAPRAKRPSERREGSPPRAPMSSIGRTPSWRGHPVAESEPFETPNVPEAPTARTTQDRIDELIDRELDPTVARSLVEELGPDERGDFALRLRRAASARLTVARPPWSPDPTSTRSVVALVGATGVGKTTTAVKIAGRALLERRLRVAMITIDTHRIGATAQLLGYADAMGVDAFVARDTRSLDDALAQTADADLLLIDTAGRSPGDIDIHRHQAAMLERCQGLTCHLVVTAASPARQLDAICDRYAHLRPDRVIVTKADEAFGAVSVYSAAAHLSLPLACATDGQQIPEDLRAPRELDLLSWTTP